MAPLSYWYPEMSTWLRVSVGAMEVATFLAHQSRLPSLPQNLHWQSVTAPATARFTASRRYVKLLALANRNPAMTIAYWCILIAALLPYVWVAFAKAGPKYNNRDPRGWLARQDNPRAQRANSAHLNAFEAFAPFAAGVLMAQFAGVDPGRISLLAMIFIAFRILHGIFYLTNIHALRSLAWTGGIICVVVLMVQAALLIAA